MDIPNIKTRNQLKSYFVKNAIPTEGNFADVIEAGLNQRDDGLVKTKGNPLSIEAGGDESSQKRVLSLYRDAGDADPACVFSLNPFGDPADDTTRVSGLGIGDAKGNTRFFIDPDSGRVGIGTTNPGFGLHVMVDKVLIENTENARLTVKTFQKDEGYSYLQLLDGTNDGFEIGYQAKSDALYINSRPWKGWGGAELVVTPNTKGHGKGENAVTISTVHGHGAFGALSKNAFHMGTSLPAFYFDKPLTVSGGRNLFENTENDCRIVIKSGRKDTGHSYFQLLDATDDGFEVGYRASSDALYFNSTKFKSWTGAELIVTPHAKGYGKGENAVTISTVHGFGSFGALNKNWFHMGTDRAKFYFNKPAVAKGGFNPVSTKRVKKDIRYLDSSDENQLLLILEKLKLASYRYLDRRLGEKQHIGVIAEEAPEEIVTESKDSIDLYDYSSLAIASIKALQKRVSELSAKVDGLAAEGN